MGMAASQARLLMITARMHDVEYKAQAIQNAKIQLATQSDQVYKEYLDALNSTTLTIKGFEGNKVQANFNNIRGMQAVDTGKNYALRASNGKLIVSEDEKIAYEKFKDRGSGSPQEFALWMLVGDDGQGDYNNLEKHQNDVYEANKNNGTEADISMNAIKEKMDKMTQNQNYDELKPDDKKEYDKLHKSFNDKLYKAYGSQIYAKLTGDEEKNFNQNDFNYFVNLYKQIEYAGGCVSISDYNGPDGDAAQDSDWLQNMIKCGKITMSIVEEDKYGQVSLDGTAPASDTNISYTNTTDIDKTKLAKVEAKYEHDTKQINAKDKKFDLDLSKLETERSALSKEYDSVKKVVNDNIERTFGIFS